MVTMISVSVALYLVYGVGVALFMLYGVGVALFLVYGVGVALYKLSMTVKVLAIMYIKFSLDMCLAARVLDQVIGPIVRCPRIMA